MKYSLFAFLFSRQLKALRLTSPFAFSNFLLLLYFCNLSRLNWKKPKNWAVLALGRPKLSVSKHFLRFSKLSLHETQLQTQNVLYEAKSFSFRSHLFIFTDSVYPTVHGRTFMKSALNNSGSLDFHSLFLFVSPSNNLTWFQCKNGLTIFSVPQSVDTIWFMT